MRLHRASGILAVVILACAVLAAALPAWAAAKDLPQSLEPPRPGERVERLANGLCVIVKERHLGGVAAFRVYIRAGSLNEGEYAGAGISHLLEHVVSGGATATRTEDQVRDALAAIGAETNAQTSKQSVCYHGQVSAERIGELIEIIGDYVADNKIEQKAFDREFEVVQRELERAEADPDNRIWQLADESFFLDHPARYPVIGHLADLRQLKHEDLVRFYHRVAVPDNAVAVAVGDFQADEVFEKIRQAMGGWQRHPGTSPVVLPPRQPQVGPREASAEMDVSSVRMIVEFPAVQLTHPDLYPLDILAFILGEGRASRLVADLRDKRSLVQSVECESFTPAGYDGGRFVVVFQADPDKAEAARQAVLEHLARVVREKPGIEELARAKRQKTSEHVFGLQQCEDIATEMGSDELLVGDPHFSDRYVRNIQNVTAEDVQRVAAAYLRPEVICTTTIRPRAAPAPGAAAAPSAAAPPAPPAPGARPAAAAPAAAAPARPQIIPRALANGVRVLLLPVEGHPSVSIQMFMRGGLSVESQEDAGISSFMARMLLRGTARRKATEIAAALDSMGAEAGASAGRNTVYLSARCLSEDFEKTFDLAADCLLHPSFPQDEMDRLRAQVLSELAHMADSPHGEALLYFQKVFFTDSPYRFPVQGTADAVKGLTRQALASWHQRYVCANNVVVAVFGGIDPEKALKQVAAAFESLPANRNLSFPKDLAPRKVPAREVYIKPSDKGAAVVYVAYPGMDIYNIRDRFAMNVLDTILSGYQMPGGWLFEELRGKGLVYEVGAYSMEGLRPGYVAAQAVCQPEKVAEVVRIIEADFARATRENFTDEEVRDARATVITAKELGRETIDGWAFEAAVDEALGLGFNFPREETDRIRQVRIEDLARVARDYFKAPVICVITSDPAAAEAIRK